MPKQAPMQWPLPEVVHPPSSVCYTVHVPNERHYIGAFLGAMFLLSKPYAWGNDSAHTAIEVGAVWRAIFDDLLKGECALPIPRDSGGILLGDLMSQQIRISPDDPCIIQMWCIDHWEDWYNPTACIVKGGSQPGNGGTIPDGGCAEYDVTLRSNEKWLFPSPVSGGFVVTVSSVDGAWSDGTLSWRCGDGGLYILGACTGSTTTAGGDPLSTAPHMALIAGYDSGSPQYQAAFNSTFVISTGIVDEQLWLQANDSDLTNNSGALSLHIKVCGAAIPSGVSTDDMTVSDGDWFVRDGHAGSYVGGVGFEGGCDTVGTDLWNQATIQKTVVNASHINSVEVTFDRVYSGFNDGNPGSYAVKNFSEGGGGTAIGSDSSMASGTAITVIFNANPVDVVPGDYIVVAVVDGYLHNRGNCDSFGSGSVTITEVKVHYTGSAPW